MATKQSETERSETPKRGVGRPRKADGSAGQSSEDQWVTVNAEDPDGMHLSHFTDTQACVLCTLEIPNCLLYQWYRTAGTTRGSPTYVQLLNARIKGGIVHMKDGKRIEARLVTQAHKLGGKVAKAKGRRREQLLQHTYTMYVLQGEADSFEIVRKEAEKKIEILQEECDLAKAMVIRSKEEITRITKEMDTLSSACAVEPNHGRMYEDVSPRHARRKLNAFTKQAQDALWFSGTFGLVPECLQVRKAKSGSPIKVPLGPQTTAASSATQLPLELSEDDQTKVLQTLYIVDQFAVSDEAYHELRKLSCDLPPLYQLKKKRAAINSSLQIERIPTMGAYRPFRETLTVELKKALQTGNAALPIRVKLSGDGARLSRSSTLILLSFSLPGLQTNMLAASGNHTFAVIRADESYENLSTGFGEVTDDLNALLENPTITIDAVQYRLEFFLGSDYKFLLLMLGINQAHSVYSCIWCDISKDERWDMSKPLEEYTVRRARTLEDLKQKAQLPSSRSAKQRCGVIHPPMLNIEPHHVVADELHLFLRIVDVLIRNLIYQMVIQERRSAAQRQDVNYLKKLERAIQELNVSFRVWEIIEKDGKRTGRYDCTSLMGNSKKKVLSNLPPKFATLITNEEIATCMRDIWTDFDRLYQDLSSFTPPHHTILHTKAKQWVSLFLSLGDKCEGFQRKNITPYIHILVYHVPDMIKRYGNIKQFSGQGVEKNNDVAKRNYFSSNLHDPAGEILKTEGRLEVTDAYKRPKRKYSKHNEQYWEQGGIQECRKRTRLTEIQNLTDT